MLHHGVTKNQTRLSSLTTLRGASAWLRAVISPPASMRFGSKMMPVSGRAVGAGTGSVRGSGQGSGARLRAGPEQSPGMAAAGG